jgi:DNA-binding Lrp family transcriptional regulator
MDGEGKGSINAYVFVRGANRDFLNELLESVRGGQTPIRYAAVLTGSDDAIAVAEVDDLTELEDLIYDRFRATPSMTTSTAIGVCPPPPPECKMPKIKRCDQVEAFVRAWGQPGRADAVAADLLQLDGVIGAGPVAGDFDVLADLCVPTLGDVVVNVLGQVQRVPSIVRTSTAFVIRSATRPEPQQQG